MAKSVVGQLAEPVFSQRANGVGLQAEIGIADSVLWATGSITPGLGSTWTRRSAYASPGTLARSASEGSPTGATRALDNRIGQ